MENLCLDTDVVSDFIKNRRPGSTWVESAIPVYNCFITSITAYKLQFGIHYSKRKDIPTGLISEIPILDFNSKAALLAGEIHADLVLSGQDIGPKDVFIASICIVSNSLLLTRNRKHFSRIPRLKLLDPNTLTG